MSGEFSLRAVVQAVLAESGTEDRQQLVKEVEHLVARKDAAEALRQALPAFVHQVMTGSRYGAFTPPAASRPSGRSPKVTAIREAWRRHLEARYTVADGGWRKLGDFGHADLLYKAAELEAKARENTARAAVMTELAATLAGHSAARVRDLPDDVLAPFFTVLPAEGDSG